MSAAAGPKWSGPSCASRGDGLVYVLTLLARNGKVTRATVDAASGELINGTSGSAVTPPLH